MGNGENPITHNLLFPIAYSPSPIARLPYISLFNM
jgi:hypothetical protein